MPFPREELLHHIWQHKLFSNKDLQTTDGELITVVKSGLLNRNAGPDFLNARLEINGVEWAGNVEIHVQTSDWKLHSHQNDKAYDNIILHVVFDHNSSDNLGSFPTLELKNYISNQILSRYETLVNSKQALPCAEFLPSVSDLVRISWLDSLLVKRLERKSNWMNSLVDEFGGDLEQAFLVVIFRAFGMKTNADAFEVLGKNVPWKILSKHQDNVAQVEAILFGIAGFLDEPKDYYSLQLKQEFQFLKHKYRLEPIDLKLWKFLRLRPANFPTIRIAQIAQLFYSVGSFYKWFVNTASFQFDLEIATSEYWQTHYVFGKTSTKRTKKMGPALMANLYINAVVPFLFVAAKRTNNSQLHSAALSFLENIKPELNRNTNVFAECGLKPKNAGESQALIELKSEYCDHKKCLSCNFGSSILKREF